MIVVQVVLLVVIAIAILPKLVLKLKHTPPPILPGDVRRLSVRCVSSSPLSKTTVRNAPDPVEVMLTPAMPAPPDPDGTTYDKVTTCDPASLLAVDDLTDISPEGSSAA